MKHLILLLSLFFAVAASAQNYCPSTALFCDDFYSQDFSAWAYSGHTPSTPTTGVSISTSIYHSGGNAAMQIALPVAGGSAQVISPTFASQSELWYQFFFYIPSTFTMSTAFNIASAWSVVQLRYASGFYLQDNNGNQGTHALTTNAWHSIQLHNKTGTGTGVEQVYIDGTLDINVSTLTIGSMTVAYLGANNSDSSDSGNLYFDDVVIQGGSTQPTIGSSGFDVRYPNSAARSALPVNVIMWGQNSTDVLSATVDGSNVYTSSGSLSNNLTFSFDLTALTAASHTLAVTLKTSGGTTRNTFSGTFTKYASGTPTVYIDGGNNLHYNGSLLFEVSAFLDNTSGDTFANWGTTEGAINTMGWQGNFQSSYAYTPTQWKTFVDGVGAPVIGPDQNWEGASGTTDAINASGAITTVGNYATAMTADTGLLFYTWEDEPSGKTTRTLMQQATDAVHTNDPNHPVAINNGGAPNVQVGDRQGGWYYPIVPYSTEVVDDINAFDFYPFIYNPVNTSGFVLTIAQLTTVMDNCANRYSYGLVPCVAFIEAGVCSAAGTVNSGCSDAVGTITLTNGSTAITGVGTDWTSAMLPRYLIEGTTIIPIASIGSTTTATLASPWTGTTGSGLSYLFGQGPTPQQTTMEAWLGFIHGLKGEQWWGPAGWTVQNTAAWTAMANFKSFTTTYAAEILSTTTPACTSNQQGAYGADARVDVTCRQNGGNIYVFAARLTDYAESGSPLSTQITVPGAANSTFNVINSAGTTIGTTTASGGVITYSFPDATPYLFVQGGTPPWSHPAFGRREATLLGQ